MPSNPQKATAAWQELLEELRRYRSEHGDLLVPQRYVSKDGYRLGRRVNGLRGRWDKLTAIQQEELLGLGFEVEGRGELWQRHLGLLETWAADHPDRPPPAGTVVDGVDLAQHFRDARRRLPFLPPQVQARVRALPFFIPAKVDRRHSPEVRAAVSKARQAYASRQPPRPGPLGIEIRPAWLSGGNLRSAPGYAVVAEGVRAMGAAEMLAGALWPGTEARLLLPNVPKLDTRRRTPPPGRWITEGSKARLEEVAGPNHLLLLWCGGDRFVRWWALRVVDLSRLPRDFTQQGSAETSVLSLPPRRARPVPARSAAGGA